MQLSNCKKKEENGWSHYTFVQCFSVFYGTVLKRKRGNQLISWKVACLIKSSQEYNISRVRVGIIHLAISKHSFRPVRLWDGVEVPSQGRIPEVNVREVHDATDTPTNQLTGVVAVQGLTDILQESVETVQLRYLQVENGTQINIRSSQVGYSHSRTHFSHEPSSGGTHSPATSLPPL